MTATDIDPQRDEAPGVKPAPSWASRPETVGLGALLLAGVLLVAVGARLITGPLAVVALVFAWTQARARREGWAFIGLGVFLLAGVVAIFTAAYPNVLPSTIDAAYNLTVSNASSTPYTLRLMSIVAAFGLPAVLAYQAWTYWVFRKRITESHIPAAHPVIPII